VHPDEPALSLPPRASERSRDRNRTAAGRRRAGIAVVVLLMGSSARHSLAGGGDERAPSACRLSAGHSAHARRPAFVGACFPIRPAVATAAGSRIREARPRTVPGL